MSEQRRNSLTSITTNKKEKKSKDSSRTFRFTLTLPEPNEEACPEFNYRILLNTAEKKRKLKLKDGGSSGYVNGVDPLAEDDDDKLKEIARQFEEKYGGSGRKKHGRFEDYVDLGAGYDENDPFIDNTDAYDELVPEEMTTAHNGFYINCGVLEFKEVSDQSDVEEIKELKIRKRLKKPLLSNKRSDILKKRKFVSHEREILKKRKKRAIDDLVKKKAATVKELLREKRESLEATSVTDVKDEPEPAPVKPVINSVPKPASTSITDVIESVISAAVRGDEDSSKDSSSEGSKSGSGSPASTDVDENKDAEVEEEKERNNVPQEEVKLPDSLSEDIRSLVMDLKLAAKTSADGKCKFFSPKVNMMLLNVWRKCQSLSCGSRQMVYTYLAFYLPCTKDTLVKRAKKLVLLTEENKLKEPLRKLADAVSKMMPALLEKYSRDCQKVAEEKNVDESKSSVSDNEGNPENNKVPARNPKIPRRVFPWTPELRELLCEVIQIKLQCTDLKKSRKQTSEDILKIFLEKEVKPLWPPGWMKVSTLLREGRDARISVIPKIKKPQVVKKQAVSAPAMSVTVATIPSATPTPASVISVAPRVPKPAPLSVPTNGAAVITPISLLKNQLPSSAKPKHPSEVTYNAAPRTKASSVTMPNSSARVHSPSSGVPLNITSNALSGNVHVSSVSSSGKLSAPSVPVKPKVNNEISVKTSSVSGKSSPTVTLDKQVHSGVTVSKIKNSAERGLDLSVSGVGKSNAVPTKVKMSSGVSITPVPMSLSSSAQKLPGAALPLMNIPDCISVTPSIPSPIPAASISPSAPKPMSLKQRILHDSAKDRLNSPVSVNIPPSSKLMDEGIEVIEIVSEKSKTETGGMKRVASSEVPGKLKTEFKKKKKMENSKTVEPIPIVAPVLQERKPPAPVLPDKDAERKLVEETATATDILSQIINESLSLPNSNVRDIYHVEDNPIHHTVIQKRVSPPPLPVVSSKEDKNDAESAKFEKDMVQPDDAEESVQLEVDRVMKELRELQGHMSGENEPDTISSKYSPPKISSSVSVVPVNNVVSVRSQQQSKSTKEPDIICKPVVQARRTSLGSGFQEEFQKHLFQEIPPPQEFDLPASYKIGKNKAVFPVLSAPKNSLSAVSEDSSSLAHSASQHGSYLSSSPVPLYPKLPSSTMSSATANPCDRRLLNSTNSSILHMQDMKSNAHNSQSGVQLPTDDQFSLFQYIHSLSGSAQQHSPPY